MSPCYGTEDFEVWSEYGWLLAWVNESADGEFHGEANACLIAAAPELLEAINAVLHSDPNYLILDDSKVRALMEAAAKAEGRDKEHG
jgi:hypothetical protein